VNIVGIQPRGKKSDFWKKHFAGFTKAKIPTAMDTAYLHQPPKSRPNNCVQPSYSDIAREHDHNYNGSDVRSPTAAETATQQTRPIIFAAVDPLGEGIAQLVIVNSKQS
jgi:hypothetical protein